MRRISAMTFRGALRILGKHDSAVVRKLDALLGGVILGSGALALSGPAPMAALAAVWGWVDQKNEAIGLLNRLLGRASERKLGLVGYERAELIGAAHTALVVGAVMEVCRTAIGKDRYERLALSDAEQEWILNGGSVRQGQSVLEVLYELEVPMPSAGQGFEENANAVQVWQERFAIRLVDFCMGLAAWDGHALAPGRLAAHAVERYRGSYLRLASEVPEFLVWALLTEHSAAGTTLRRARGEMRDALATQAGALSRLETLLSALAGSATARQQDASLLVHQANFAALDEPIVPRGSARSSYLTGIQFPLVRDIYIEPRYSCASMSGQSRIADEHWWRTLPVHRDLDVRLTAHFASPEATRLPLILLGHPGAGKSVLTRIIAARLPSAIYTAVYVPLRHVSADAPIYEQVQQALTRATHGRVDWGALTDQTAHTLRVIILDGLDELLQAADRDRTAFLHDIVEFQRREADLSRPVAVIVTSRTVVADRVDVPAGAPVIKLADFDAAQIESWRTAWNAANREAIASGTIRPLSARAATSHAELAGQPLLLLMLALYSADPALEPIESGISETTLYRMLLENFAARESGKIDSDGDHELDTAARLHQLSVAALAMFNRGRQHVTDVELGADLMALAASEPGSPRLAERGQQIVAQFFFVYTAQAVSSADHTVHSYEFLHATFGEYLVAREIAEVVRDTAASSIARRGGRVDPNDDLLYALLSHDCLAIRQPVLTFAAEILNDLTATERALITDTLGVLTDAARHRPGSDRYGTYQPTPVDHVREVAAYSANLTLLRLLTEPHGVPVADLFGTTQAWTSTIDLWRAGLNADSWYALLSSLHHDAGNLRLWRAEEDLRGTTAEIARAELAGDMQLALSLRMGSEIRSSLSDQETWNGVALDEDEDPEAGLLGPAAEELLRWLIPALIFASGNREMIHHERLAELFQELSEEDSAFLQKLVAMLLKQRARELPYEILEELTTFLLNLDSYDGYALLAAVVAHPEMMRDNPQLQDVKRYAGLQGTGLMFAAETERSGQNTLVTQLAAAVDKYRREIASGKDSLGKMAASLLDAYQWQL
jgi:hypothetical protein